MAYRNLATGMLVIGLAALQGCAPLVVAGGATAVSAAHDRRTLGAYIDDQAIELKAVSAINADEAPARETHVNVTSVNGVVLLSGETPTTELRDRVLGQVRAVPGVRRIVNEIRISPLTSIGSRGNDAWLTTKVRAKMLSAENLDASHVKVVTENGVVYLLGLVTRKEGEIATEASRRVGGVQRVVKLFEYID